MRIEWPRAALHSIAPGDVDAIHVGGLRPLVRFGQDLDVLERPVVAAVGDPFARPGLQHDLDVLAEARIALLGGHVERGVLGAVEAAADPPVDPAARQHVEQGDLLGDAQRVVERGQRHRRPDPQTGRPSGDVHRHEVHGRADRVRAEVVLGQPHPVVAGAVHHLDPLEGPVVDRGQRDPTFGPGEELQHADLHGREFRAIAPRPVGWADPGRRPMPVIGPAPDPRLTSVVAPAPLRSPLDPIGGLERSPRGRTPATREPLRAAACPAAGPSPAAGGHRPGRPRGGRPGRHDPRGRGPRDLASGDHPDHPPDPDPPHPAPEGPGGHPSADRTGDLPRTGRRGGPPHHRREPDSGDDGLEDQRRPADRLDRGLRRSQLRGGRGIVRPVRLHDRSDLQGRRLPDGVVPRHGGPSRVVVGRPARAGPTDLSDRSRHQHGQLRQLEPLDDGRRDRVVAARRLHPQADRERQPTVRRAAHRVGAGQPGDLPAGQPLAHRTGLEHLWRLRLLPGPRVLHHRFLWLPAVQPGPGGLPRPPLRRKRRDRGLPDQRVPPALLDGGTGSRRHLRHRHHPDRAPRVRPPPPGLAVPRPRRDLDLPGAGSGPPGHGRGRQHPVLQRGGRRPARPAPALPARCRPGGSRLPRHVPRTPRPTGATPTR